MNKKHVSLALVGLMGLTSVLPTFAYEKDSNGNSVENIEYQNTKDEDFANQTNVFAELGSEYKVTIPKTIILSGTTKKANYTVKVEGDIAGYETVNVEPDSSVELRTKNKDSQTGTITQDKTSWKFDNFDIDANGTVEASSLTAGKWSGTFNFNINLEDEQAIVLERVLGDLILPPVDEWNSINVPVTTSLNVGETGTMNALKNSLSESEDMTITSSNENVATITDNKIIRALSPGTTKITTFIESKENTKSFSFDLKVNESSEIQVELPEAGTKLSDMSFAQIQKIAREGKTADYNIKLGDAIKINDTISAEIVAIGDDYIELLTIQKIIDSSGYTGSVQVGNSTVKYNELSSFYIEPQVNNGITNTAQVSYVGSNIQKQVEKWLDKQSDEFKSALKDTERTYEVATLTYNGTNSQTITGTITETEKIYIPTAPELKNIYKFSKYNPRGSSWLATPYPLAGFASAGYSFGRFCCANTGSVTFSYGTDTRGAYAMFRIG